MTGRSSDRLPRPSPGVVTTSVDGDAVLYDAATRQIHLPDPVAAVVWAACGDGVTLEVVVAELAAATGADPVIVAADVGALVDDLRAAGLVERGDVGTAGVTSGPDPAGDLPVPSGAHASRVLAVLDHRLVVHGTDATLVARVEELCRDLVVDDGRPPTAGRGLHVAPDGTVEVSGASGAPRYADVDALLDGFPAELNRLAATSTLGPVLHAGAVRAADGGVVVLPGEPEAGKSTLTASLVQAGWDYVTDEAVGVRPGSLDAVSYPKPLALGPRSLEALGLAPQDGEVVAPSRLRDGAAVPPGEVGPVTGIVLARYVAGASVEVERLRPIDALRAMQGTVLNLHLVGAVGLEAVLDLLGQVPCHRLVHGGGAPAVAAVTRIASVGGAD